MTSSVQDSINILTREVLFALHVFIEEQHSIFKGILI